ncbi:MAG TPA: hypothetical protein VHH54_05080, partial [Actinomycetota bacterium]|nr:hypothetical protein [Actinomycetota bacterium]
MKKSASVVGLALLLGVFPLVAPAAADHTNPKTPLSSTEGDQPQFLVRGQGSWQFIRNFKANPGTDLKFFIKTTPRGTSYIYSSSGTLGQADAEHVGQRILQLARRDGTGVNPRWYADHGSSKCSPGGTGVLSLQHDAATTGYNNPRLLIDTTDTSTRCHDRPGGGLELIDISGLGVVKGFEAREIHLTRHVGTSHTVTTDATRPWILYNNSSSFTGHPWMDVLDVRTCMLSSSVSLDEKRNRCRPKVYRINFADDPDVPNTNNSEWGQLRDVHTGSNPNGPDAQDQLNQANGSANCHDVTALPGRILCAGLNATMIFDVSRLTDRNGNIRGTPLPCTVIQQDGVGESTSADITDCATDPDGNSSNGNPLAMKTPSATGWTFLGTFNHPGRDCTPHSPGTAATPDCNNNNFAESDEGVAVAHETDLLRAWNGEHVATTDERGGGVVPPGASC